MPVLRGQTKIRYLEIRILDSDKYKVKLLCVKCGKVFEMFVKRYKKTMERKDGERYT